MSSLIDLSEWLQRLPDDLQPQADELAQVAENQRTRILERTQRGLGYDLQVFAPYSPRTSKGGSVTLSESGRMLDSIQIASNRDQARIYFDDEEQAQLASFHNNGTRRMPERPFFGASLQDREEIVSDLRQNIFRRINK